MSDFPSEHDIFWLLLGLFPLAWLIYRSIRGGLAELATIGSVVTISLWCGYHLTPWLAVPVGGWDSFLLRPEYVTDGIRYATLGMLIFLVAYAAADASNDPSPRGSLSLGLAEIPERWIWLGCAIVLVAVLISRGGPVELLYSSTPRGAGQFEVRDTAGKLFRILNVFIAPASFVLALLSSLYLARAQSPNELLLRLPLGAAGLFVASIKVFASFSRGAGFAFVLLAMSLLAIRGWRAFLPAALAIVVGIWLGLVGYTQRGGENMPGVANFLGAVVAPDTERLTSTLFGRGSSSDASTESPADPSANVLNALDPWTTRAWTREKVDNDTFDGLLGLVQVLQPLPSELVPWQSRAGESLSVVMGTWGSTGITTPALGELYYLLGDVGLIAIAGLGLLAAWAQRRLGPSRIVLWTGFVLGSIIGLHNGLRAMTRPMLYAIVLVAIFTLIGRIRAARRSASTRQGPQRSLALRKVALQRPVAPASRSRSSGAVKSVLFQRRT